LSVPDAISSLTVGTPSLASSPSNHISLSVLPSPNLSVPPLSPALSTPAPLTPVAPVPVVDSAVLRELLAYPNLYKGRSDTLSKHIIDKTVALPKASSSEIFAPGISCIDKQGRYLAKNATTSVWYIVDTLPRDPLRSFLAKVGRTEPYQDRYGGLFYIYC